MSSKPEKGPRVVPPISEWPGSDAQAWARCRGLGRSRLSKVNVGSWASSTVELAEGAWGTYLGFLEARGWLDANGDVAERIREEWVLAYGKWQIETHSVATASIRINALFNFVRAVTSDSAPAWLRDYKLNLAEYHLLNAAEMPEPPAPAELAWAGFELMRLAQAKSETDPQSAALMFRDGLMIAVVAFHGNRRREILELEDGTNIQKTEAGYVLQVYARNSKTKKPNRSDINRVLVEVIDEYRARHRPVLVQLYKKESGKETQAFFVSPSIGRMGGTRISAIFARRTKQVLGTSWSPQQFRRAITSDAVRRDPKLVMLAAAVNRHSLQVAMKHYNAAQRSAAERRFQEIFDMALDEANL